MEMANQIGTVVSRPHGMEREPMSAATERRESERNKEMRQMITLLPLLAVVSMAGAQATAQVPQRIQFAKGRSSAVVKGTTGSYGRSYVLRAKAGQKLIIDVSPAAPVGVKVETEGAFGQEVLLREEEAGGRYEIGLEETGDYTIFIGPAGLKPVAFTMSVLVTRMTDI